jgi:hypothetical protein
MSLYIQTVPVLIKYLRNLSHIVQKGVAFAEEKGLKVNDVLEHRLVADQQGLIFQVQACCNTSKFAVARLGIDAPVFEDNEKTVEDLQIRISKTIALLESADKATIDSYLDKEIIMSTRMGDFVFKSGQAYVSEYVLANFHFHLSTAYCLLRAQGVPLGALDYMKDVFVKHEAS